MRSIKWSWTLFFAGTLFIDLVRIFSNLSETDFFFSCRGRIYFSPLFEQITEQLLSSRPDLFIQFSGPEYVYLPFRDRSIFLFLGPFFPLKKNNPPPLRISNGPSAPYFEPFQITGHKSHVHTMIQMQKNQHSSFLSYICALNMKII